MLQTSFKIRNNQTEYMLVSTTSPTLTGRDADRRSFNNMGKRLTASGQSLQQFGFFSQTASASMVAMFRQVLMFSKADQPLRETYNMLDKKPEGERLLKEYTGQHYC